MDDRGHSRCRTLAPCRNLSFTDALNRTIRAEPAVERGSNRPYHHPRGMVLHMKTTLNIDDTVLAELRQEAARQNRPMSELVETALRNLFRSQRQEVDVPPLPVFHSGGAMVDIADRDALYQAMEGR
jgi:hypothetical protein